MRKGQKGSRLTVSHVDTSTGEGVTLRLHNPSFHAHMLGLRKGFFMLASVWRPAPAPATAVGSSLR